MGEQPVKELNSPYIFSGGMYVGKNPFCHASVRALPVRAA